MPTVKLSVVAVDTAPQGAKSLTLAVEKWRNYAPELFAPFADPLRKATHSRTIADVEALPSGNPLYSLARIAAPNFLASLVVPLQPGAEVPRGVRLRLQDRKTGAGSVSNVAATDAVRPPEPRYAAVRRTLEQPVAPAPFAFPPALHPYIAEGITPGTGGGGFVRHAVATGGRYHTYLQDAARRSVVYILPGSFKLARRPDPPFTPFATVRVTSEPDGSGATMILDYVVAPIIDPRRLALAREELLRLPHFGATGVTFAPLPTSDVPYRRGPRRVRGRRDRRTRPVRSGGAGPDRLPDR